VVWAGGWVWGGGSEGQWGGKGGGLRTKQIALIDSRARRLRFFLGEDIPEPVGVLVVFHCYGVLLVLHKVETF